VHRIDGDHRAGQVETSEKVSYRRDFVALGGHRDLPEDGPGGMVERRNQVFACHPDQAAEVIGSMRRLTTLPIFAKLTADTTSIVDVAEGCVRAGAHGFSCINTLLGMSIDIETGRPRLGAGRPRRSRPAPS